jgi:hypothetical protein
VVLHLWTLGELITTQNTRSKPWRSYSANCPTLEHPLPHPPSGGNQDVYDASNRTTSKSSSPVIRPERLRLIHA